MAKCIRVSKPHPMTLAQARAKARERWERGHAIIERDSHNSIRCVRVGFWYGNRGWTRFVCNGEGPTFEAAFADADRREAEAKEKMSNGA